MYISILLLLLLSSSLNFIIDCLSSSHCLSCMSAPQSIFLLIMSALPNEFVESQLSSDLAAFRQASKDKDSMEKFDEELMKSMSELRAQMAAFRDENVEDDSQEKSKYRIHSEDNNDNYMLMFVNILCTIYLPLILSLC